MKVTLTKDMVDTAKAYREAYKDEQVSLACACVLAQLGMAVLGEPVGAGFNLCNGETGGSVKFLDCELAGKIVNLNDTDAWEALYSLVGTVLEYEICEWSRYE